MDSTQVQKRHQTACALRRTTDAALLKCVRCVVEILWIP